MRFKELDNSVEWFVQTWQKKLGLLFAVSAVGKMGRMICF